VDFSLHRLFSNFFSCSYYKIARNSVENIALDITAARNNVENIALDITNFAMHVLEIASLDICVNVGFNCIALSVLLSIAAIDFLQPPTKSWGSLEWIKGIPYNNRTMLWLLLRNVFYLFKTS